MISKKHDEIIKKLESKIEDKELLNFLKTEISDLAISYTNDLEKNIQTYGRKIDILDKKINNIENVVSKIEKDFLEETTALDLEPICCPYCNFNFLIEYDSEKTEMKCPECENIISLDWGEDDEI
ncbi:MAG: hypothetical protein J6J60_05225 [Clostridia bacterium]|nr:hypothetical protein [Clostridia bacterium]